MKKLKIFMVCLVSISSIIFLVHRFITYEMYLHNTGGGIISKGDGNIWHMLAIIAIVILAIFNIKNIVQCEQYQYIKLINTSSIYFFIALFFTNRIYTNFVNIANWRSPIIYEAESFGNLENSIMASRAINDNVFSFICFASISVLFCIFIYSELKKLKDKVNEVK